MSYKSLYSLTRYLRKNLPLKYPVYLRRVNLPKERDGECIFNGDKFIIKIQKNLPEFYSIEVMIHEMSHCLSWGTEKDLHGVMWGKSYSIVYRKFLEWNEKN